MNAFSNQQCTSTYASNTTSIVNDFYSTLPPSDLAWRDTFLSEFHEQNKGRDSHKNKTWLSEDEFNTIRSSFLIPGGITECIKLERSHLSIMKKTNEAEDVMRKQATKIEKMKRN